MGIETKITFPKLGDQFAKHRRRIELFIAASMQTNRGLLFDAEGAYNGHKKWAGLKFRTGQILSQKGNLRKSIAPSIANGTAGPDGIVKISGDVITIGTKLFYARMMNDGTTKLPGGVLRAKKVRALKIPMEKGFIFRKSVKIPARNFDELNNQDIEEFSEGLMNVVSDIISKGDFVT